MNPSLELPRQVYRLDALIGCGNLLGFAELLAEHFGQAHPQPLSLLSLDINSFAALNENRGHEQGDVALRWIGIVLEEETRSHVFRVGGDELACVLMDGTQEDRQALAWRIFQHLNQDARKFGLGVPAASISLIHYAGDEQVKPADVLVHFGAAILEVKQKGNRSFKVFHPCDLDLSGEQDYLLWLANQMIDRMVALGGMLDESNRLAYTDPVTGLPNLRAAQQQLEAVLAQALAQRQAVSILLVDGDDLRDYNNISYAAGDEMIQRLGATLSANLRPGDFLARWRVGDEFLIILPGTPIEQAILVGKRLCRAVQQASQDWPIPVTISVGVAGCLERVSPAALLEEAEAANKEAKDQGKNRVLIRKTLSV